MTALILLELQKTLFQLEDARNLWEHSWRTSIFYDNQGPSWWCFQKVAYIFQFSSLMAEEEVMGGARNDPANRGFWC